ncbi:MAG: type VI secretion system tube protein Hcp [Puniceicoccaceae bacterium]
MNKKAVLRFGLLISLILTSHSFGEIQVLMKLDGITLPKTFSSKSELPAFTDGYITIQGASSGYAVSGTDSGAGSRTAGRADFSEFSIFKPADEITPILTLHGVQGSVLNKVIVVWVEVTDAQARPAKLMEFTLENVRVSGGAISGSEGDQSGTESTTFVWEKMTMQSFIRDDKGGVTDGPKVVIDATNNTASS